MRVFLALTFVFICLCAVPALAQNDAVTDDDVMKALHGGGAPAASTPRQYAPSEGQSDEGDDKPVAQPDEAAPAPAAPSAASSTPPAASHGSLNDLKAAQDARDNDEGVPALQAIGEGAKVSCPSREVAATLKMPETNKMIDPNGNMTKARKCEDTFERLPDACSEDNPCADCDKAVKAYSDACMYVENRDGMTDMSARGAYTPPSRGEDRNAISKIPYQQGRKP